jgi:hypothetical protein
MDIVRQDVNVGHLAHMLLEVRDKLSAPDLPNSALSLGSSSSEKLGVEGETDSSDPVQMCVVYHPETLAVLDPKSSNNAIVPARNNNFVGES